MSTKCQQIGEFMSYLIVFSLRIWYNKTNKNCVISVFFGSLLVGEAHSVARMGFKRPEVQILSPRPPRRSKVRFAPTSFLLLADASAAIKPPSPRSLAPPFPQKAPLGSPVRLQARSQRLAVATNLLRLPRLAARGMGRDVHTAPGKACHWAKQYGVRPSEKPPHRCKVRFAPASFCF